MEIKLEKIVSIERDEFVDIMSDALIGCICHLDGLNSAFELDENPDESLLERVIEVEEELECAKKNISRAEENPNYKWYCISSFCRAFVKKYRSSVVI